MCTAIKHRNGIFNFWGGIGCKDQMWEYVTQTLQPMRIIFQYLIYSYKIAEGDILIENVSTFEMLFDVIF